MVDILAQVSIPYRTTLPEDVAVNTWSFRIADDTETELAQVGAFLQTFYEAISNRLSPVLDLTQTRGRFYNRADPEPRSPLIDAIFNLGVDNTGGVFPEEVAAVLSFRGVLESGQPAARRRGRVFLGPLSDAVLTGGDANRSVFSTTFVTQVLNAYEAAWAELTTAGNAHVVWSTTDGEEHPVVQAWMDNALDTQRRRGVRATARDTRNGPF